MAKVEEVWVPIEGFENYKISNYGTVINSDTNQELKRCVSGKHNIPKVRLYKKSVQHTFYVRRLVAGAFFLNFSEKVDVKNINGDLLDCSVLNLTLVKKQGRGRNIGGQS